MIEHRSLLLGRFSKSFVTLNRASFNKIIRAIVAIPFRNCWDCCFFTTLISFLLQRESFKHHLVLKRKVRDISNLFACSLGREIDWTRGRKQLNALIDQHRNEKSAIIRLQKRSRLILRFCRRIIADFYTLFHSALC